MDFKEAVAWEAEEVFLNLNEFAETKPVTLNGVSCVAQVIGPQTATAETKESRDGVSFETAVIIVGAGAVPLPRADREINWNGDKWIVSGAQDNKGLFRIELYREKS